MRELLEQSPWTTTAAWLTAFFGGLTLVNVAAGFALERAFAKRRVFAVPRWKGQLLHELVGNLVFVGVTVATFTAAFGARVFRFGSDDVVRSALTFLAMMFGFQVFYYWLHRLLHTRALIRFHRWHHRSRVTNALSGQSVSVVEACGWMLGYVGLPILLSRVVPIGFWGYAAYMAFNVSGNVVGHSNVELSAPASGTKLVSAFANPFVYHALHHARWTGHYGFQAAFMDRIFGTEYADWPALFRRILSGTPLASLQERGEASSPEARPS